MNRPQILLVDDTPELLRLLTHLLRENGFDPIPAGQGKEALRAVQAAPPALAVIDILLPDMTGYQLAESLRRTNASLPVIFISGVFRGSKQAAAARQKYGAADFFEKPFNAHELMAAIRRHVPAPEAPPPERMPSLMGNEPACEEDHRLDPMEISGVVRLAGGKPNFASPAPSLILQPPAFNAASIDLTAPAQPQEAQGSGNAVQGDLGDSLPSLINAFHLSRETGELVLSRGRIKKVIFFRSGMPVYARSNVISDRLGQFLFRIGKITEDQLAQALTLSGGDDARVAETLVRQGLLNSEEAPYFAGQQVKSIIYSVFCWEDGAYGMNFHRALPRFPLELDLHPGNLILRATRRLYKAERLQRLLSMEDRLIPSLQPTYALNELELETWEARLLPRADGTRTVAELIAMSGQSALKAMAFLYAMLSLTILERRA